MELFDFLDYKEFVNDWVLKQPKNGYGQFMKMSRSLNVNSVVLSQIFRGDRHLTEEQSLLLTKFIGLTDIETDFFLLLVQKSRAGTMDLVNYFLKKLENIRRQSQQVKNRVPAVELTFEDKSTFYSQWYYSAIRLGVSIENLNSTKALAEKLGLDVSLVTEVVSFLLKNQLVSQQNGKFKLVPSVTHIGNDSNLVTRHHANWRIKALQAMEKYDHSKDLFYTGPMVLSLKTADEIRKILVELIEKSTRKVSSSESEVLRCLNIDWFSIIK